MKATRTKNKITVLPCVEPNYGGAYTPLSERKKAEVDVMSEEINYSYIQRGEKTYFKQLRKLEKLVAKSGFSFDLIDEVYYFYIELEGAEYYKELTVYIEDGYFILNNGEFNREIYVTEYNEAHEIFDYLEVTYSSIHKNGLILTR